MMLAVLLLVLRYHSFLLQSLTLNQVLSNPTPQTTQIFAVESRNSLSTLLASKAQFQKHNQKKEKKITKIDQPDEPISFAQLMVRDGSDALEDELRDTVALCHGEVLRAVVEEDDADGGLHIVKNGF